MNRLLQKYYKQFNKDYQIALEFYQIKIAKPLQLTLRQHIKIHGLFKIVFKIVGTVLIKMPLFWPFLITTYLWGLVLTYSFLPLICLLEWQIERQARAKPGFFSGIDYNRVLYGVLQFQGGLKTWGGLMHVLDLLSKGGEGWPRRIVFIVDNLYTKGRGFAYESGRRDEITDIWLRYLNANKDKIINNSFKYLGVNPKWFINTWLNPHSYKIFRLVFYKINRRRFYTGLHARWIIRYKIFKGLLKYRIIAGVRKGRKRLLRRVKYVYRMIKLRGHIRHLYNRIVLKIYKTVYYVSRELIYIGAGISLFIEILLIVACKLLPLVEFLAKIILRLLYLVWCLLTFGSYNVVYSYEGCQVGFIKGCGNSFRALKAQKKFGSVAKNILSHIKLKWQLNKSEAFVDKSGKYVTRPVRLKNFFTRIGNRIGKLGFGNEAILFSNSTVSDETDTVDAALGKDKPQGTTSVNINEDDVWTKIWKGFCPPLWLKSPYPKVKTKVKSSKKAGGDKTSKG